ncbi:MAG: BREX-4 system phosphatase PglZ [Prevotella sp.]
MYKAFETLDELYKEIEEDKNWVGAESALRNRYPLRFVLFEKFSDFNEFVLECSNHNVYVQGIDKWMADEYDDQLITYSQLAMRFEEYVKSLPANDFVIAPFSEIARFYDNGNYAEFDSLLQTIRLIQSPEEAQRGHQRIYVPVIGMQGKVSKFKDDPNIYIWEYHSATTGDNYKLILAESTYGVKGLSGKYTICSNVRQWIDLWKVGNKVCQQIICTSKSLFNNAHNAQPDNAFEYVVCRNAYDFLRNGLGVSVGTDDNPKDNMDYWGKLAHLIDIEDFDFEQFVNRKFNSYNLTDAVSFVETWFECEDDFSRWLLKIYYLQHIDEETYLSKTLRKSSSLGTSELFSLLATLAFDEAISEKDLRVRCMLLKEATKHNVQITEWAERKVKAKLMAIAADPERGYFQAMKYMSSLTISEKCLMVEWLGKDAIQREMVKDLFPLLYSYTSIFSLQMSEGNMWVNEYFEEYKKSKLACSISPRLVECLKERNANEVTFDSWRSRFKTVKTLMNSRSDIDVYYWIDGLGVDWIPFISKAIERHRLDGVYLNEIHICTAELPTTTMVNKIKLEELAPGISKIGDLDHYAHSQKEYPLYFIEEMQIVEKAILQVLAQYKGKKIAFVADHGLSYLACLGKGLNIAGIEADHGGRCANFTDSKVVKDDNYIILEDGKTLCSLTHNSLTSKTPNGQGAHGGATPEEVLVPVVIVSSQKNASDVSAKLLEHDISANNPIVKYIIKGVSSIDIPAVVYNGVTYSLRRTKGDTFESERLNLVATASKIVLKIGDYKQTDSLNINIGVQEDDLFDF